MKLEDLKRYDHEKEYLPWPRCENISVLVASEKGRLVKFEDAKNLVSELEKSDQTLRQLAHMLGVDPDKRSTDAITRAVRNLQVQIRDKS